MQTYLPHPYYRKPIYTRAQIKQLYEQHRKGAFSKIEWMRLELEILAAGREGRILNPIDIYRDK